MVFPIVAIRWLLLSALAATLGALTVDVFVLPDEPALQGTRRRLRWWTGLAVMTLALGTLADGVGRTAAMTGGWTSAFSPGVLSAVARTHYGWVWLTRMALVGTLSATVLGTARRARAVALTLAMGVALTVALAGHFADWGDVTVTVGLDWLHIVFACTWTGGVAALTLVAAATASQPAMLATVGGRFSRIAGGCLLGVLVTGLYNAWVQLPTVAALWTTGYGRALLVKMLFVGVLTAIGCVNRYAIVARLDARRRRHAVVRVFRRARLVFAGPSTGGPGRLSGRFVSYLAAESVVALVVFACTAVLGESTPPRHAGHGNHRHLVEPESPVHTTMDALHAAGGLPPGWIFAPPRGNAGRGRQVFAQQQCYACHTVAGEAFPPATGPGPELTGVGKHHPAGYIAESILNPSAVIVEGSGYSGPDGRSTMPDYRDTLSLADFIDLVEYLRGLHDSAR